MSAHEDCEDCKRLFEAWEVAVTDFSVAVSKLCDSKGRGFSQAHNKTEAARRATENARNALDVHRSKSR